MSHANFTQVAGMMANVLRPLLLNAERQFLSAPQFQTRGCEWQFPDLRGR